MDQWLSVDQSYVAPHTRTLAVERILKKHEGSPPDRDVERAAQGALAVRLRDDRSRAPAATGSRAARSRSPTSRSCPTSRACRCWARSSSSPISPACPRGGRASASATRGGARSGGRRTSPRPPPARRRASQTGVDLEPLLEAAAGPPLRRADRRRLQHRVRHPRLPRSGAAAAPRQPIQHDDFIATGPRCAAATGRAPPLGWERFSAARPNPAHHALAELEEPGALAASSPRTWTACTPPPAAAASSSSTARWRDVRCLACGAVEHRDATAGAPPRGEPGWLDARGDAPSRPTATPTCPTSAWRASASPAAALRRRAHAGRRLLRRQRPRPTLDAAWALFDGAEALLVVGSSLTVFSGFRFVRRAAERGVPVAIVNHGPTRGDDLAAVRLDARAGEALPLIARALA